MSMCGSASRNRERRQRVEKAGLARALIRDVCKQFDQDKVVWDRQKYNPTPIICEGDGPIAQFRKYYSRYYAGTDGVPASSRQGAD